ncbi:MAG TPA: helix-turn-helix domain-containing protein [Terriglobales bacterium]|nr:helix-turn-helix domain-containing protein [Terriglobales bacterium]
MSAFTARTRLLTTKQTSEMLAVPVGTLRYWRNVGVGPAWVKLEGSVRYDERDVLAYINRNRHQPSVREVTEAHSALSA